MLLQQKNMANIKKNFLYSSFLTTANYVFPMITYPYVSRVLGVENIGLCNFIDSIINYFLLFSFMGINILGVREIARAKEDCHKLNTVYNSLFFLNFISTVVAIIILVILTFTIPQLFAHVELMVIGGIRLLFSFLQVEWFFKGIENFKFITIRSIIIKCFYVIAVFVFVRNPDDYPIYYLLMVMMVVLNSIVNVFYSLRFIHISIRGILFKPYIKSFFILGIYTFLTSMYTSFNVAFLGFTSSETEVGYYTTATKLYAILLGLFTAFTGVMMPRMSVLISEKRFEEFKSFFYRSVKILFTFSMPLICFSIIMAPQIIDIISGKGYEGAIIPMRIVMPLMLIIGYEQILVVQTLMPLKSDRYILRNSIIGAVVGLLLNIFIVPLLHSVGSSIVWGLSEIVVLVCSQFVVHKQINLHFPWREFGITVFSHLPLCALILPCAYFSNSAFLQIGLAGIILLMYCYVLNRYIVKNQEIINVTSFINRRIYRCLCRFHERQSV